MHALKDSLPIATGGLWKLRSVRQDGCYKAFDAWSDGFVRDEGCGVVGRKRLADEIEDGDPVLAVIRGSFVNQDGRSSSLTAPSGAAQEAVIRAALERAGAGPTGVGSS